MLRIMSEGNPNTDLLTFGEHLDVLRKMLFRIILVIIVLATVIFCFKTETFKILLAPRNSDFCTFQWIERMFGTMHIEFKFDEYNIPLISTELSAQFMTHITVSCILGALFASPYIMVELFRFISPALYENEKRYSLFITIMIYSLFIIGVFISYFILFPISYQFLATYQVDTRVTNTITLDSYISTFATLTFMMGIVFQLPVFAYILGKMGLIVASTLKKYRPYAFILIMIIAAIITPPDIFTLILVTVPIYLLYELSIWIVQKCCTTSQIPDNN